MRRYGSDPTSYRLELLATYRYLRLAIILLTVLLGVAVWLQVLTDGGVLRPSVSAYYYSPAGGVFVAALCAIGACMIIHRGRSDLEDVLLNLSGYLAFVVAFVPTGQSNTGGSVTIPGERVEAVINNTWAVLIVGALGFVVELAVVPQHERASRSRSGKAALAVSGAAYVALLLYFLLAREQFLVSAHGLAAILLFIGIVCVVGVNAIAMARAREQSGRRAAACWRNRYTYGFAGMVISAVAIIVLVRPWVDTWLFLLEAALIAQFVGFWITQTVERWREPEPPQDLLLPG